MILLLSTILSVFLGIQATNNYDAEVYLSKCVVVYNMMKNKGKPPVTHVLETRA